MATLTTPLCRQLGIAVPVVQAPIGSAVTTELVAAVADAGGLGTLALTWVTAEEGGAPDPGGSADDAQALRREPGAGLPGRRIPRCLPGGRRAGHHDVPPAR
ncbi:nitronate monooxygenase [Streptomyces decoyicus]|uniref:nitronate monooxygenase n=1 Tax=Streptomyces decoyicus TaxID=249567 RepID=UPI000AEA69AA|nr:nitronate monooxygenase [Streptomyces decoyicus]